MKNIEAVQNHNYDLSKAKDTLDISMEIVNEVFKFHESIGNQKTPLIKLSGDLKQIGAVAPCYGGYYL